MGERPSVFVSAVIRRGCMNQYNNMRSGRGSNPSARNPQARSSQVRSSQVRNPQVQNPQAAAYSPGSPRPARMPQPAQASHPAGAQFPDGAPHSTGMPNPASSPYFAQQDAYPEADSQPAQVEPLEPSRGKKALNRVVSILTTVIFVVALAFTLVVVATTLSSRGGEATFFGWKPYIVLSDSMQTEFQVGDIAVSRAVDTSTLAEGDIITFESIDPDNYGEIYTHKIRERTTYEGQSAFVTYGTTTGDDDLYPALESKVVGEYVFAIPKAGYVFDFFKSPAGYVVLVLIPFSILIGLQVRNIVRLVKDGRASQSAALAAEQQRVREMQKEIDRLRSGAEAPMSGRASRGASGAAAFSGDAMREPRARAAAAGAPVAGMSSRLGVEGAAAPARGANDPRAARRAAPSARSHREAAPVDAQRAADPAVTQRGRHTDEARSVRGSGEVRPRSASSTAAPRERAASASHASRATPLRDVPPRRSDVVARHGGTLQADSPRRDASARASHASGEMPAERRSSRGRHARP